MAGDLIRRGMPALLAAACLLGAAGAAGAGGTLADPTRPPSVAYSGNGELIDDSRRLTSVILPKDGQPSAVIGGHVVPLGGKVGNARLVHIDESGVLLSGPDGRERLFMTPDVTKKTNLTNAAARRTGE